MSTDKIRGLLVNDLINCLNNEIEYVILRGYENINSVSGDVDLMISKNNFVKFLKIIDFLKKKYNLLEINRIDRGYVFMFRLFHHQFDVNYGLKIDIHFNENYRGAVYLDANTILDSSIMTGNIKIPSFEHQVIFNFLQPILGMGYIPEKRVMRIRTQLKKINKAKLKYELDKLFDPNVSKFLFLALTNKKMSLAQKEVKFLRNKILFNYFQAKPLKFVRNFIKFVFRQLYYKLNYPGLFIVFIGPDGAGKSTAIKSFIKFLNQFVINKESLLMAWRPEFLPRLAKFKKGPNLLDKASKEIKVKNIPSQLSSFFRYTYYVFDYILGHFLYCRRILTKEGFIIYDRYYYDYLIQPSYRSYINLPYLIKELFSIFIPKPDLIIYFKSDPKTLFERKQEETFEELSELVLLYENFIKKNKAIRVVDANKSKTEVVFQIIDIFKNKYGKK